VVFDLNGTKFSLVQQPIDSLIADCNHESRQSKAITHRHIWGMPSLTLRQA
jgi:hypothetical protein